MKSVEQTLDFIAIRIGHIYFRPLMYGGSAEGVDLILNNYHEVWADIVERREDYDRIRNGIYNEQNCGSAGFAKHYTMENPHTAEEETTEYVVTQWKRISEQLNIEIPYDKIKNDLQGITSSG